jgi:type II secretory pathway pseudopilin PulG
MLKNKIKAFTLMEVTVAMVLAAISIGISFTVYQLLSKAYRQYDTKNRLIAELVQLDQLLKKDISAADKVFTEMGNLICQQKEKVVIYSFTDEYITRNQESLHTDSFFIRNGSLLLSFEDVPLESDRTVDQVEFDVQFFENYIPRKYTKFYSAQQLMNMELLK